MKDPKAIKEHYSSSGCFHLAEHTAQKLPPCHHRVPLALILQLCSTLAGMSTEEKLIFHEVYNAEGEDEESQRDTEPRCSRNQKTKLNVFHKVLLHAFLQPCDCPRICHH